MGYTKRQFVEAALEEIGIAGYTFDADPDQFQSALRRLDALLATWNAKGIQIGYLMPTDPENSELASEAGTPDSADEAIITNLAIRIAPSFGKIVSMDTKITARKAYNALLNLHSIPPEMKLPSTLPKGAGHKSYRNGGNYIPQTIGPITRGQDGDPILPASI